MKIVSSLFEQPARTRSTLGFTLVELLVVITIVSLLISLLLPALSKARDSSKMVQCVTNLRGQGTAAGAYMNDYKDQYGFRSKKVVTGHGFGTQSWGWDFLLWPYMRPEIPGYFNVSGVAIASGSWPAQAANPCKTLMCPFDPITLNCQWGATNGWPAAAPNYSGPPITNYNSYNIVQPMVWDTVNLILRSVDVTTGATGFWAAREPFYFNMSSANGARVVAKPSDMAYIFDGNYPRQYTNVINTSYFVPVQGIGHATSYGAMISTFGSGSFQWDCAHPANTIGAGPWGQGLPNVLYADFHVKQLGIMPQNLLLNTQLPFRIMPYAN